MTAAAAGTRRHTGTYPAEPGQVRVARAALAGWLEGWPRVDEAVLIGSEFVTNAVLHSASADGGAVTLRAEVGRDRLRIEVEDAGGAWRGGGGRRAAARVRCGDGGRRGGELGHRRGRRRAGRLGLARAVIRVAVLPPPADAARISRFLAEHLRWSAYWDKKYGVWRVAEDDPDSDLYVESTDADIVIGYITAHA